MPAAQSVLISPAVLAAAAVVVVGAIALWANPRRLINRMFFTASLHVALWLACVHMAVNTENGLIWLRASTSVGAFLPLHLWWLKQAILVHGGRPRAHARGAALAWTVVSALLGALPLTHWFVPAHSTAEAPVYGWGYYGYAIGLLAAYAALCRSAIIALREQTGVTRIELQIALIGGSAAAGTILLLMLMRTVVGSPLYLQPFVILVFYAATALAITTHRIFDARHLLIMALQRLVLVLSVAAFAYVGYRVASLLLPPALALVLVTGLALALASVITRYLDTWFLRYPKAVQARSAAFAAAQREMRTQELRRSFGRVLRGWGQAEHALILSAEDGDFEGENLRLPEDDPVAKTLRDMAWATPERLARERDSPARAALRQFLQQHDLGCLVMTRGPTLAVIVGVGVRPSRRPFTFPEINQLRELASIFESALSRTHLLAKAQRAEQLATVGLIGAGVAHEIRNPLVSIKTFVQLLPTHYHDEKFRERFTRLIGDEVERIDRLTEQLMDLAAPKQYQCGPADLHAVIESAMEIATVRAQERAVDLRCELNARPCIVWGDVAALKQVVLNLTLNAIQAHEPNTSGRWVRLETVRHADNTIQLIVTDNGPGIPAGLRDRLFEPFNSTKSSGFGLGLTVCSEILSSLNATISVDSPEPGHGATFRVHLQCPPPTS
jgi:signal transduction histidine kinase